MKGPRGSSRKSTGQICLSLNHSLAITTAFFFSNKLAARCPRARILAVSRQPEEIYAERALRAGASGYWMKTSTRKELIRAIDTVLAGELYVSPRIALRAVHEIVDRPAAHPKVPNLTDRELHVFCLERCRSRNQPNRAGTRDQS